MELKTFNMLLHSFEIDEKIGEDFCGCKSKNIGRTKADS